MNAAKLAQEIPAIAGGAPLRPPEQPLIFGAPVIGPEEIAAVTECLKSRWIGTGARVAEFEQAFASYKGAPDAAAVSSCSAALHLALVALGIGSGDEVIVPSMTFCATANAVVHVGATPVLADCNPANLNVEATDIEPHITPRTRALIVVHMCGRACDMKPILALARRHRLRVIEDCAHSIETMYYGSPAGLIGDVGCFSFYATKNLTTADGGMVISRDRKLLAHVKRLSMHGISSDAWRRANCGPIGYQVVEAGFKCNLTDMLASLGLVQLGALEKRWLRRDELWRQYDSALAELPLQLPPPPEPGTRHALHLYTPLLCLERLTIGRDQLITALRAENIGAGIHYMPVHVQPYYRKQFGYQPKDLPAARRVGQRIFSLPLSAGLTRKDADDVCQALRRIVAYFAKQ